MKILDKLKNALFEEEYVEVEEPPIKPKKEKVKEKKDISKLKEEKRLKDVKLTSYEEDEEEFERPIAKKIESVPLKPVEPVIVPKKEEPIVVNPEIPKTRSFLDEDFAFEEETPTKYVESVQAPVKEEKKPIPQVYNNPVYGKEKKEEVKLYKTSKEDEYIKNYTAQEYGNYEKEKEKKVFKPSPNISPIYGIIDESMINIKNQPKKEVRLTSAMRNEKMNVDEVRQKAFGTIEDDLKNSFSIYEEEEKIEPQESLLVDLREDDAPEVNKITMGDAEEYFQDLGLEYDTDYIDASKAKASGRRLKSEAEYASPKVEVTKEEDLPSFLKEKEPTITPIVNEEVITKPDEDNLFDLIDSMYDR